MNKIYCIIILACHLIPAGAQNDPAGGSFGLFESEDMLNISLRFDIARYMDEKPSDEQLNALITFHLNGTDSLHKRISLRSRGHYRNRICDFPPLMLNFKGTDFGYSDLDDMKNVKLVSHCMPDEKFENYILKEYLAYKLFNIISDYSFRVRLLKLDYIDINYDTLYISKHGFLIEPVSAMKKRFGMQEIEDSIINPDIVDVNNLLRVSLYQYLIANSDWNISLIHNLKVFSSAEETENMAIAVPYDFDFTGWVNTDYAVAMTSVGLEEITDRAFFGPCNSMQEYKQILNEFLLYKEVFIELIKDFKYLKGSERRELIAYIRSFYKLYKNDEILKICMEPCNMN